MSVDTVIQALRQFEADEDETENVYQLNTILEGFRELADRERALTELFAVLERCPEAELGSPGPLVREIEAIEGYEAALRESMRRQPTCLTVWMVRRVLNSWRDELGRVLEHPLASEPAKADAQMGESS